MKLARDIIALCSQVSEDLAHVDVALPGILAAIHADASTPHVRAQSYDGVRVSGTRSAVIDFGDGDELVIFPTDPTGEAVVTAVETEEEALRDLLTLVRAVQGPVASLLARAQRWQLIEHELTTSREVLRGERAEQAREVARVDRANEPCCRSCAREDRREPVVKRRVVDGDTVGLCRWCYDFTRSTGRLPTREELAEHHAGGKVRRRVAP